MLRCNRSYSAILALEVLRPSRACQFKQPTALHVQQALARYINTPTKRRSKRQACVLAARSSTPLLPHHVGMGCDIAGHTERHIYRAREPFHAIGVCG